MVFTWVKPTWRLSDDEAWSASTATAFFQPSVSYDVPWGIRLFGRPVPLAFVYYTGPFSCYSSYPFIGLAPGKMLPLKLHAVFWAVLLSYATYRLAMLLTRDFLLSAACAFLLPTFPGIISSVSMGAIYGLPAMALGVLAFAFLAEACIRRVRNSWYLSCAAIGLSLGFHQTALALFAAWGFVVFRLRKQLGAAGLGDVRTLGLSLILISLGSIPFALGNLLFEWQPAKNVLHAIGDGGLGNVRVLDNLWIRTTQLPTVFAPARYWLPAILICACALVILWHREQRMSSRLVFVAVPIAGVYFLSSFTLAGRGIYHLFMLLPFVAVAIVLIPSLSPQKSAGWAQRGVRGVILCGLLANFSSLIQNDISCQSTVANARELQFSQWATKLRRPIFCSDSLARKAHYFAFGLLPPGRLLPFPSLKEPISIEGWNQAYFAIDHSEPESGAMFRFLLLMADQRGLRLKPVRRFRAPRLREPIGIYRLANGARGRNRGILLREIFAQA